ncbi:hypothetical protein [Synechocystis sp. LKSZ1]|uniref:hypothetical protein n=1 Tax=Synechocystis sp. LKSZ1 TaxID=3144951 RepID=UPI00336BEF69
MKYVASALVLGCALSLSPLLISVAPANESSTTIKQDKKAMVAEVLKLLNDDQKMKLLNGIEQGQEIKDILPSLDLSREQKVQLFKIMKSAQDAKQ